MASPPRRRLSDGTGHLARDAFSAALSPGLHRAYDAVLHEPMPKELLIASGEGTAKWDGLRREWGTHRPTDE